MNQCFENSYKVDKVSGCWEWQKYCQRSGYGQFKYKGKMVLAHRVAWELYCGSIPKRLCVLHKCDNPSCVNPKHLWLGTPDDNAKDMVSKGRQAHVRGERNGNSKLTKQQVLAVRADSRPSTKIASAYGISTGLVSYIRTRKLWVHV